MTTATVWSRFRAFLRAIVKSCYDMEFYRGVRTGTLGASVRYALFFALLVVSVATVALLPFAFVAKSRLLAYVDQHLPANAELSLVDGKLSSTLSVPFDAGTNDFRFIIDPSVEGLEFPSDKLKGAGLLLGRDAAFAHADDKGKLETYPFKEMPNRTITKTQVTDWLAKDASGYVVGIALLGLLLYWVLLFGWMVIAAAAYSVLALLFARIWKVRLTFTQWLSVSLHALTLALLGVILLTFVGLGIPFAFTVLYFLITASVVADERSQPTSGAVAPADDEPPTETPPSP